MIESTVTRDPQAAETAPTFPALYASTDSDLIVLFTSKYFGVILQSDDVSNEIGSAENWGSCTDTNEWRRLSPDEIVQLRNV